MSMHPLRALAVVAAMSAPSVPAMADSYTNPHLLMSPADVAAGLDVGNLVVLDVRPNSAFMDGHIPGARQLDPDAVADPDSPIDGALRPMAEIATMLGDLGVAAGTHVVLYDDKGGFHAARMFWLLEYMGHRRVSLLNGGIQAWEASEQTLEKGEAMPIKRQRFAPALTSRRHATADWILERRNDPQTLVVDVRPTAAFDRGHIPWALSIPWKGNLNADKTMKSGDALRAHFAEHGVTPDHTIVVHCQNGLASAHSYFALRLIGFPQIRTYHRSWAEWGTADDLPIAVKNAG